jgi:hypothetical protein
MELIEDDEGRFVVQTHYGYREDRLNSRVVHTDEFAEVAEQVFEKKAAAKFKRDKDYRRPAPGENIFSPDLMRILSDIFAEKRNEARAEQAQAEHRKLAL